MIRVDAELWRQFMEDLHSKHLRTCSVLEAFMTAHLYSGSQVPGLEKPQTVNITITREIYVPDAQKGVEARMKGKPGDEVSRKWSPRRVPSDARCIGCKHHGRQEEYHPAAQSLLVYHWCIVKGLPLCDISLDVLRTCELRETP